MLFRSPYIKQSVRLCKWSGQGSIKEAVKYADSHNLSLKIKSWNEVGNLPEIPSVKEGK